LGENDLVSDYTGSSGVEFYPPNPSQVETRLGVPEGTVLEENLCDTQEFSLVRIFPDECILAQRRRLLFPGYDAHGSPSEEIPLVPSLFFLFLAFLPTFGINYISTLDSGT
jgi:hypothetical protein